MEEGIINIFDNMIVLNNNKLIQTQNSNFESKKWIDELKKIQSMYSINTTYKDNKTLLFGYKTNSTCIIPIDILMNQYDIIVPKNIISFVDNYINMIVNYLIQTIKITSSPEIANQIRYKLTIYLPITHSDNVKMRGHPYFMILNNTTKKTKLERVLTEDFYRYDMIFKFTNDWNVVPFNNIQQGGIDMME